MSRYATLLILLAIFLATLLPAAGCGPAKPSEDERFVALVGRYLDGMLARNPVWATSLGDHRFDGRSPDLSAAGIAEDVAFTQAYLDTLQMLAPERLSQINAIDYQILTERLEYDLFMATEVREHQWNPLVYNPGDGIYNLIARDFAPLSERLANVRQRLDAIPELLAAARANLENPPRIFTETAITQNRGAINLVMDGLQPYLTQEPAPTGELKSELMRARAQAIAALEEHGRWLEEDLLPRSNGDFRLGERLYRQKLRFALASDRDPEDILARAERDLADTRHQMRIIATPLFVEFFPSAGDPNALPEQEVIASVLEKLAQDRPTDATIVPQAERDLSRLTEFVREQRLVTVPDDPVRLIVMPEHQRGLYIGYCDSPGPLEERGETFFAIAPSPEDWPPERKESFYAEYNDYMLQNLTIHEAMPGHYLQLAHANKFEAPTPLRAIFSSGTFVEGWATYAEQLMVEAGWGGPQLHLQQLKMRLRLIINAIIDPKIHTGEMTEEQALAMMMIEGFQEEGEAVGKWRRACLTSTQLSTYYIGNIEINDIRRDYEAKAGNRFDYREFHDELLSYGSPPPKYMRQLLGL
jgi:uncharacterized protein (DUF885 family)